MVTIVEPTDQQLSDLVASYLSSQPTGLGFVIGYASQTFSSIYRAGNLLNQRQQPLAFTNDTPFEIASASKTFTATLYQSLIGNWAGDPPIVGNFVLDIGEQFGQIPLLSLMNYTSGLPADNAVANDLPRFLPQPYTLPGVLGYLNFTDMKPASFGQEYRYSNLAFAIMAAILPMLAKIDQPFEDLMAETIFEPLGLSASMFFDDVRLDQLPLGYQFSGSTGAPVTAGWPAFPGYNAAGGIVSTPNDMMAWLKFNMGLTTNKALSPLLATLQTPSTTVLDTWGDNLGVGWFITQAADGGYASVWKDGDLEGFSSFIAFLPSSSPGTEPSGAGVFVLTNSGGINDANGVEICSSLSYDVLNIMQGLQPSADTSLYPRTKPTRPVIRRV